MASSKIEFACESVLRPLKNGVQSIEAAKITVKENKISEILWCASDEFGQNLKKWQDKNKKLIVFKDKLISPAFINAHTHIAMNVFRGLQATLLATRGNMIEDLFYQVESKLHPEDVCAFARMGAYENLLNGVGMVWDHYYHSEAIVTALSETGLAAVVAPTLQDLSGPGVASWERSLQETKDISSSAELQKKGIFAALGPHASDTVSGKLWKMIASHAKSWNLPVHSHLAQSIEEQQKIQERENCSPVMWLKSLGILGEAPQFLFVHNTFADEQDLKEISSHSHISLGVCPFSSLIFACLPPVQAWERHGIPWLLATDCAASNDSMNVQKELRYVSALPIQGLSYGGGYQEFLTGGGSLAKIKESRQNIWSDSLSFRQTDWLLAKLWSLPGSLHPQFKVGAITEDSLANLVVWDLSHPTFWPDRSLRSLAFGDTAGAIHHMMVAGKWLSEAGNFHNGICSQADYKAQQLEAERRFQGLLKRISIS